MLKKITPTAENLRVLLIKHQPQNFLLFNDIFAVGCLMHAQGNKCAGLKLIKQVIGLVKSSKDQKYLNELFDHLEGNEFLYANEIQAHHEINVLLNLEQTKQSINVK